MTYRVVTSSPHLELEKVFPNPREANAYATRVRVIYGVTTRIRAERDDG